MAYKNKIGFGHHWFIGSDSIISSEDLTTRLDNYLKVLNDDYEIERKHALNEIKITVLPQKVFYDWMKANNKLGGQNKFPRVLKGLTKDNWISFLNSYQELYTQKEENNSIYH
jgi:hypothetical protein